ncbi:hypothetical protein BDQ12DRAFT_648037 [Crucibulum laeve]|uniref:PI-PLC Y-box domain-containing protein n=1 Tax=Crucibulum laeve TaxID=68775 RepID=A0A5C3M5S5_9AGAR|nr:hypothetical protein BDQ12DRAFT_648037 [Crucibulum laeve]
MVKNVTLVVDDQDKAINYLCPSKKQTATGYYNNTRTTIDNVSCGSSGWFQYTFQGTGIRVIAVALQSHSYSVKIDDGAFEDQSGGGYFESPILPDGQHTLTYAVGDLDAVPMLDYLTVTPGPSTQLMGQSLVVDDSDDILTFSGKWSTSAPRGFPSNTTNNLYQGTSHWSSTVGDSFQFQFAGTSVSLYGALFNAVIKNISLSFVINGVPIPTTISNSTLDTVPFVQLFHTDLQTGNQTVVVNIMDISSEQAVGFDLITYNANFNNLASMPTFGPSAIIAARIRKSHVGAICGGIVGLVLVIVALIVGFKMSRNSPDSSSKPRASSEESWASGRSSKRRRSSAS